MGHAGPCALLLGEHSATLFSGSGKNIAQMRRRIIQRGVVGFHVTFGSKPSYCVTEAVASVFVG